MIRTALALFISQAAFAAAPFLTELQPRGAERGHAFKLTIVGRDLGTGARIVSTLPATFTPVNSPPPADSMMSTGRSSTFLVEPKPEATPGVYPIRIESDKGISTVLLFSIGAFPAA